MRKLILITALLLASAAAQAGQSRGLVLASNDVPQASEKIDAVKPAETKPEVAPAEAPKADADVKPEASAPEASKPDTKPVKKAQVKHHESDEAKARRIAARYGISW